MPSCPTLVPENISGQNMRYRYCFIVGFIFSFFLCFILQAKEPVRIIQILDTNLFKTADGKIISLANVKTISIQDPDSLRQKFTFKVYGFAEKSLINKVLFMEVATENDSVLIVHLWDEMLESVNKKILQNGYGYFDPEPDGKYQRKYEIASQNAKDIELRIYNAELFRPQKPLKPNAIWLTKGIGIGKTKSARTNRITGSFSLETSFYFRRKWFVALIGSQTAGWEFHNWITSSYICVGKAFYDRYGDIILTIGVSRNQWEYDTESERGIIKSDYYYGAQLKIQSSIHLPQLFGAGLSISCNYTKETSYFIMSANLSFGFWNFYH
ncbi:hypothetical protein H8E88_22165 [candidate division KSB1 bacterium]|nr:hypothetical protein [candidate division KSB1 bacterium]MBL7093838.1 hypothetical protein [candidate division KSB1 bacterium]